MNSSVFAAADQVPCTEKQYRTAPELPCAPCDGAEGAIEGETMGDGCFFVWYVVPWYTTTIHHLLQSWSSQIIANHYTPNISSYSITHNFKGFTNLLRSFPQFLRTSWRCRFWTVRATARRCPAHHRHPAGWISRSLKPLSGGFHSRLQILFIFHSFFWLLVWTISTIFYIFNYFQLFSTIFSCFQPF